jgi:signal transduction histidine kinase
LQDEIFFRGSQGLESDGTGIGLHLVKTLVDRYGGSVWIEDNDPEGTVFCIELQLAN